MIDLSVWRCGTGRDKTYPVDNDVIWVRLFLSVCFAVYQLRAQRVWLHDTHVERPSFHRFYNHKLVSVAPSPTRNTHFLRIALAPPRPSHYAFPPLYHLGKGYICYHSSMPLLPLQGRSHPCRRDKRGQRSDRTL
jgi:hypothetical protein